MTDDEEDRATIRDILLRRGSSFVRSAVEEENRSDTESLTVVCNAGVHPIPKDFIFGELYIASQGNLDFTSIETVNATYDDVIRRLHEKLMEKSWKKIYMFPFGHSTLCMNIKLAIYRTLRIETVDVFYFGHGRYGLLEREMRQLLVD